MQVCPPHSCSWVLGDGRRTSPTSLTWSCSSCSSENAPKKFLTVSLKCCCTISCPIRRQIKAIRLIVLTHRTTRAWAPLGKLKRTSITSLPSTYCFFPSSVSCFLPCQCYQKVLSSTTSTCMPCTSAGRCTSGQEQPHNPRSIKALTEPFPNPRCRVVPSLAEGTADCSAYPMAGEVRKPSTGSSTSWLILGRMSMRVVSERHTTIF